MKHAYYNENDPFAAEWLRNLITAGLIADGEVDERSILDVRPGDLAGFQQCHFFAGIGGWSYALRLAGWPDDRPVWTGSCPCQPFSAAGKRKGFADDRHLWPDWQRLIAELRPAVVFGEQVASAAQWLRLVRGDLEALGYAVGAIPIEAASAGADHLRDRYWFVANAMRDGAECRPGSGACPQEAVIGIDGCASGTGASVRRDGANELGHSDGEGQPLGIRISGNDGTQISQATRKAIVKTSDRHMAITDREGQPGRAEHGEVAGIDSGFDWVIGADGKARRVKPGVRLLVDGFPARVGLLRGFGNAIDPRPAAAFITAAEEAMRAAT
jgi:DNA (cytosine-5)-methyltransferase 1